jgi:hypothetical protein
LIRIVLKNGDWNGVKTCAGNRNKQYYIPTKLTLVTSVDGEPNTRPRAEIGSDVDIGNAEICLVTANSSKVSKLKPI